MSHRLSSDDISRLAAGRVLDTLVAEYVLGKTPVDDEDRPCRWFDNVLEDGQCPADKLFPYSTDLRFAMSLAYEPFSAKPFFAIKDSTPPFNCWVTFSGVPAVDRMRNRLWCFATTLELAICRAALVAAEG